MWNFFKKPEAPVITEPQKRNANRPRRNFNAASIGRLFASLPTQSNSVDYDIRQSLDILRARSRSFTVNNSYGRKFLQMCSTHIVGPSGFYLTLNVVDLDMKGGAKKDNLANKAIEASFYKWAKKGNCDVTGYHSFFDICNLIIKAVSRDGEALVRKVYGRGAGPWSYQLQILDIDRLDVKRNEENLANGSYIKMGVELSKYGKPIAYHLRTKHPGDSFYTYQGSHYERVPADNIYHIFIHDRAEQNRGVPWMHAAMTELGNLGGYEEAAIVAARQGAAKMGFYTSPDGDGTPLADGEDESGNLIREAEPGVFDILPEGYGFEKYDPDYPHSMYADFVKSCLRSISSGLGVAYNTLSNDLEGVNFSSIRTGVLEERDNWMVIQKWFIEYFLDDMFSDWLRFALISNMITLPNGSVLPASKFDRFNAATWRGRRWQWVDPNADTDSNIKLINAGLKSRKSVISEMGSDIDDVFSDLEDEAIKLQEASFDVVAVNPNHPDVKKGAENVGK